MNHRLCFSMALSGDGDAIRWLHMVRAAGFDGVEPTLRGDNSLPCAADPRASAEKLRKLAERADLAIPSMRGGPGFWPTFAAVADLERTKAVQRAGQALEAVKIMGGDTLLIVPGQWEDDQTYGQMWARALDTARRIAEQAENIGVKVGLENVENRFLLSPREWMQFLDEVGSRSVRMYFDVGNVVYRGLGCPEQWLIELGLGYITRIHFKDATRDGRLTYLLEGDVNWPAVRRAMEGIGYRDWVGIELSPPSHHPAAMLEAACRSTRAILSPPSKPGRGE